MVLTGRVLAVWTSSGLLFHTASRPPRKQHATRQLIEDQGSKTEVLLFV